MNKIKECNFQVRKLCLDSTGKKNSNLTLFYHFSTSNRAGSAQVIDPKKEREKTFQKNMSQMTITLVVISSLVRVTTSTCGIYWLFAYDLIAAILGVSADTAIALNATVPFLSI
jgi:hypothetical protein